MSMKVLFVCTGNTCRSSMAVALAARELEKAGIKDITVWSAGTCTVPGLPASKHAVAAMEEMGIDIKNHRSASLDEKMLEESDLILTMTENQRQAMLAFTPAARKKVFTLAEYAVGDTGMDIADPYGGDLDMYRRSAGQIAGLVARAINKLTGGGK